MQSLTKTVTFFDNDKTKILYHGSLKGIRGPIKVNYSEKEQYYDFGPGFYCAEKSKSALNLLYPYEPEEYQKGKLPPDYVDPYLYKFSVDLSDIKGMNIKGMGWALFVAYNHKAISQDKCPEFCDSISELMESIDLIKGPISDDKTFLAFRLFLGDNMTFDCFDAILRHANTGNQYVFHSQNSLERIKIQREYRIKTKTCQRLAELSMKKAPKRKKEENEIIKTLKRKGLYLSELIEEIKEKRIIFPKNENEASILSFKP